MMLSMNETYLLYPLLRFGRHDRDSLLSALRTLEQAQPDPYLRTDIRELAEKVSRLTETALAALKDAAADGSLCGLTQYPVSVSEEDEEAVNYPRPSMEADTERKEPDMEVNSDSDVRSDCGLRPDTASNNGQTGQEQNDPDNRADEKMPDAESDDWGSVDYSERGAPDDDEIPDDTPDDIPDNV